VDSPDQPTAVQALADVHDTPRSWLWSAVEVGWIVHVVPFQCSANVRSAPTPSLYEPTATQAIGDEHDTPFSWAWDAPTGLGICSTVHVLPFQRSTKVKVLTPGSTDHPAAVQASADVHDTADSAPPPGRIGVGWITHANPFQRWTNGCAAGPDGPAPM
jgi:hypothetical protein